MEPIRIIRSRALVIAQEHVDTDRIIPARFLTTTSSAGLGAHAFADVRADPDFPLNDGRAAGASILVAGRNFGCGSSREHAAWALRDLGVRVVISPEIADIFRANAVRNGILPVLVPPGRHAELAASPFAEIEVDLEACEIRPAGGEPCGFEIDPFDRTCLMQGIDHLGFLLRYADAIDAFDAAGGGPC